MMPALIKLDLPAPKPLTVPVAAYAAGVSAHTLRGWLRGGAVHLLVPRRAVGAWLRVAPADAVRLAALGNLVHFGFTVAEANTIVWDRIDPAITSLVSLAGDIPWPLIASALAGRVLRVSRPSSGTVASMARAWDRRDARHEPTILEIHVGLLAGEVRRRAAEMNGGVE